MTATLVLRCPNCQEDVLEDTLCPICGRNLAADLCKQTTDAPASPLRERAGASDKEDPNGSR